jgi:hypothetical protein
MALTKVSYSMIQGDVLNVRDYGALGDGSHDDTAAIQKAIDDATAVYPSKTVFFPCNLNSAFYKITAPLVCTKPVRLSGESTYGVTIIAVNFTAGQYILDLNNATLSAYFYEVEHLTLRSDNYLPNGMRVKNCSYSTFRDLQIFNCSSGIICEGTVCFTNSYDNVHFYGTVADSFRFLGHTGGGQHYFSHCTFTGENGFVIDSTTLTDGVCLVNCNFEQCNTVCASVTGGVDGLSFIGCRTEGNNSVGGGEFVINPASGKNVRGLAITGCSFSADAGASTPIFLGGSGGLIRGFSITGNSGGYVGNPYFVFLNGDGESGIIAGNFGYYSTSFVNVKRSGVVVFGNETNSGKAAESWGSQIWGVEPGTWTPIDSSGAGLTLTIANAVYYRIGRIVTLSCQFSYPATADASSIKIGGLPFAISQGTNTGALGTDQGGAFNTVVANYGSGDFVYLRNSSNANPTNADFSTKFVAFQLTYTSAN